MTAGFDIRISPWYDLVFHALACIPLPPEDHSCLYDRNYVRLADARMSDAAVGDAGIGRTLCADAHLIASLYAGSARGHLLQAVPCLWSGIEPFMADINKDFVDLVWPDPVRQRLADSWRNDLLHPLPDLFRTALWSELANGFRQMWQDAVRPRAEAYQAVFEDRLHEIAEAIPDLAGVTWILCHPLRRHGRVFQGGCGVDHKLLIAVGVCDDELDVDQMAPVFQGCHELFVSQVSAATRRPGDFATVPGRTGYAEFYAVENAALRAGATLFTGSRWERSYAAWLEGGCTRKTVRVCGPGRSGTVAGGAKRTE